VGLVYAALGFLMVFYHNGDGIILLRYGKDREQASSILKLFSLFFKLFW